MSSDDITDDWGSGYEWTESFARFAPHPVLPKIDRSGQDKPEWQDEKQA